MFIFFWIEDKINILSLGNYQMQRDTWKYTKLLAFRIYLDKYGVKWAYLYFYDV